MTTRLAVCAADALVIVCDFKALFKSVLRRLPRSGSTPSIFPKKVADFKQSYPVWYEAAYSNGEPTAPPIAESATDIGGICAMSQHTCGMLHSPSVAILAQGISARIPAKRAVL